MGIKIGLIGRVFRNLEVLIGRSISMGEFKPELYDSARADAIESFSSTESYAEQAMDWLHPIYDAVNGGTVLDYGCGTGNLMKLLLERYSPLRVDGMDVSHELIDRARARVGPRVMTPDEMNSFVRDYSLILCCHTLAHLQAPETDLIRIYSLLRAGGTVAFLTPNFGYCFTNSPKAILSGYDPDMTVLRCYGARRVTHLLKEAGFVNVRVRYLGELSSKFLPNRYKKRLAVYAERP